MGPIAQQFRIGQDAEVAARSAMTTALFKTSLCKNFAAGVGCRFGDRCNFAHGANELRKPGYGVPLDQ